MCKKGCSDPNVDVFVLKLGKNQGDCLANNIEIELRTPKSPTAEVRYQTTMAQTYEEEFTEAYNGNKSGKAGGKKKKK